jgi:hypothetical protein
LGTQKHKRTEIENTKAQEQQRTENKIKYRFV